MQDMLTVDEAFQRIASAVPTIGVERLFLRDAPGRVLAESIEASEASPPFDNSAMDGYAIRHADGAGARTLVGEAAAGHPFEGSLGPGQAIRIFTGAPVPESADTVVIQEDCIVEDGELRISELPDAGANIRFKGENIGAGEIVLDVGDRITPGDIALLASYGRSVVYAFRRPRVAIISSGDELLEVDRQGGASTIVNSNAYMLEALVREAGGEPVVLPIARDTMSDTRRAFSDALAGCDLVVSAGGVSVGDHDRVGIVIEELGTEQTYFWKVLMKPGKPLAFALSEQRKPIIGLPGNPVSSFVGFHLFVAPAIAIAQSIEPVRAAPRRVRGVAAHAFGSTPKRQHFVAGTVDWSGDVPSFSAFTHQSSGNLGLLRSPTALADVAVGKSLVASGEEIELVILPAALRPGVRQ
jgi:molybdopterin molybdotransferase